MQKRIIFLWMLALSMLLTSCFTSKSAQSAAYQSLEPSLLWEITSKQQDKPSYLLGTIHMIPADKFFWTDQMEEALQKSDNVVFELDMNEMTDMSKVMGLMEHLFMAGDTTLKDLLTEEELAVVDGKFQEMGLPMFMFERMKPFFLTVMLSEDMKPGGLDDGSIVSYEFMIQEKAERLNKPSSGLETLEYQASIFDKIPYVDQAKILLETIQADASSEDGSQIDRMVKLYTQQDIEGLSEMINDSEEGLEWQEDLLFERNRNWIELMEPLMQSNSVFFAVGAGHLPGEQGVIHLLRQRGYKVKPLK